MTSSIRKEISTNVPIYSSRFRREDGETIGALVVQDVGEMKQPEGYLKQSERLISLERTSSMKSKNG